MMKLADGSEYVEGQTVWQWGHVPTATPFIQSFENTRLSERGGQWILLDDDTVGEAKNLYATREGAMTALESHLSKNNATVTAKIKRLREESDRLEQWLKQSDLGFLLLKNL